MRTSFLCVLCIATHLAASLPLEPSAALQDQQPQEEQETLVTLDLGNPRHDTSARDKRTIGFLRQLFPTLSKTVDDIVQNITRFLFRVIGRLVLQGGLLGGGGGGGGGGDSSSSSGGGSGPSVSVVLPTFPPSPDDEEEEDNTEMAASEVNPETENQVTGAESQLNEVRVQYADPMQPAEQVYNDQEDAASGGNGNPADVADEGTEEDQRNKRFLNFGFGADSSSSSSSSSDSGSGGGSGNFLFDIIRLVAGSGNTDSSNDGKPAEVSAGGGGQVEKDDGYQAGIPGPITRLFIIANRGIANLVQDLILRLAQTSERIVNFKARLITAII
ncbi:RNA-binding protein cabeza-like isoform X2 [Zootermopsis nevadensis]|uniref:RNA-binding protein cabeza-like isoform X2 n=1 Tax=Zootermopsis nevadensis TaxID=136037 RepID=UPI000B8E39FB|nr:RNA-binding protein cabeza-like isoform X2 [Zootermopsis nevadensis]